MLKQLCIILGVAAAACAGNPANALVSEAKDALDQAVRDVTTLAQERFADRTGGDQDFIDATREYLRGTYDAIRDLNRQDCTAGIAPEATPVARVEAIQSCEVAKQETAHELLNRTAYMWQSFKPPYGGMEVLLKVRSDIRRFARLVEDDGLLYPDVGAWPNPRVPYNPGDLTQHPIPGVANAAASEAQARQIEALQAQVAALVALARQAGLQVPGAAPAQPAAPVSVTPSNALRQLPASGNDR